MPHTMLWKNGIKLNEQNEITDETLAALDEKFGQLYPGLFVVPPSQKTIRGHMELIKMFHHGDPSDPH